MPRYEIPAIIVLDAADENDAHSAALALGAETGSNATKGHPDLAVIDWPRECEADREDESVGAHAEDETTREAENLYPTFTEAKIRKFQNLTRQQIATAWEQGNSDALLDLRAQEQALTQEMLRRVPRQLSRVESK